MNTSRTRSFRKAALRLIALPAIFMPITVALADDPTDAESGPVAALKASLPTTLGFEVDDVRTVDSGVACITYRVSNNTGGESRAHAVVEGDKVLRSTSRSTRFAKAWNSKCAGASGKIEHHGRDARLREHLAQPEIGKVIAGSGGVRKLRWAMPGRGKRGSLRVIYFLRTKHGEIWPLTLYAKNVSQNISSSVLRKIKATRS